MPILWGYLLTYCYVFFLLGFSALLKKRWHIPCEATRKAVHIGCGFAWFIMAHCFGSTWHLIVPPLTFVILNYISYKKDIFPGMERDDKSSAGTVYYALSMTVMAAVTAFADERFLLPYGIALLCLSLGDGLAPIFGRITKGNRILYRSKTLYGSLSVFLISFLVIFAMSVGYRTGHDVFEITVTALLAALLELFGRKGRDNLLLPIGVSGLLYLFLFA